MEGENKEGKIKIVGYSNLDYIIIKIEDNGRGMSNRQISNVFNNKDSINRVGLINVHERIQLNYGKEYGIEINSEEGKGTSVKYVLPK